MTINKHISFSIALLCGVLSLPAVATTGILSDNSREIAVTVPAADLNLSEQKGVEKLYQRLKSAARQICGSQSIRGAGSLELSRMNKQCYLEALDSAVHKVDNDKLTLLHTS
ncbi:MAG: UrcA family protein [Pseudomonadota bacterium]